MTTARMMQDIVANEETALLPKRARRARNKKSKNDHRTDVSLSLLQEIMNYYLNGFKPFEFLALDDIRHVLNLGSLNKAMNALMKSKDNSGFFLLNNYNQALLSGVHQLMEKSLILNNEEMLKNIEERVKLRDDFNNYSREFSSRFFDFLFGLSLCSFSDLGYDRVRDCVASVVFGALCCVLPVSVVVVLLAYDPALIRAADKVGEYIGGEDYSDDARVNDFLGNMVLFAPLAIAVSIGVIILMSALRSSYEFPLYFGRIGLSKYRTSGVDASLFSMSDEEMKAYLSDVSDQMEALEEAFDSHFKVNKEGGILSVAKPAVSLITLSGMFAHSPNYTKVAKPVADVESQVRAINV